MNIIKWLKRNYRNIITILGPVVFEIVNQISGDWINSDGRFHISTGKFITILIGVSYLLQVFYFAYKETKSDNDTSEQNHKIEELEKIRDTYKENTKSLCNIFGYTTEKICKQISDYKKNQLIDTYYMNITNAATIVCERIYGNIVELYSIECNVTVNYYRKYKDSEDGKLYTEMIAHEGYNTNPKYYHIRKLLKIDSKSYYCERLLSDSNPDVVFLDKKEAVKKSI